MSRAAPTSVLVVEDHDSSAADYVRWLSESGHQVTRASARDDALSQAERVRPDVVVLDLKLPSAPNRADQDVRHGIDVLEWLVRDDPFRRIVVVTAHSNDREIMRDVLQRTSGGQFVFKDAENLESDLREAVAVAMAHPAYTMSRAIRQLRAMLEEPLSRKTTIASSSTNIGPCCLGRNTRIAARPTRSDEVRRSTCSPSVTTGFRISGS